MRKGRFTEEQTRCAVQQAEAGISVPELCPECGVAAATFLGWKAPYGGLGVNELRELRQFREENRTLKGLVADLKVDSRILREALNKKESEAGALTRAGGLGAAFVPAQSAAGVWGLPPERQHAISALCKTLGRDRVSKDC
jgi:putative transposase